MELGFSILNDSANGMALKIVILFVMIIFSMIIVGFILKILKVPGKIINFVITAVGLGFGFYWLTILQ
ncbi:hypothetical protein [Domibacillus robiginosus]|uniref:hypothetical protein n=1 Tax=Domibacillus robiginosus TaxID=1071054 RepID=UPI00067C3708|nr:hypothetical protein [Domibacillus robiginosus]